MQKLIYFLVCVLIYSGGCGNFSSKETADLKDVFFTTLTSSPTLQDFRSTPYLNSRVKIVDTIFPGRVDFNGPSAETWGITDIFIDGEIFDTYRWYVIDGYREKTTIKHGYIDSTYYLLTSNKQIYKSYQTLGANEELHFFETKLFQIKDSVVKEMTKDFGQPIRNVGKVSQGFVVEYGGAFGGRYEEETDILSMSRDPHILRLFTEKGVKNYRIN